MTTLAIIGGGIVGRSLLYNLTAHPLSFDKILLFESNAFAFPCSLRSTAIVAPRGVSAGHSPLGDMLLGGLETFSAHIKGCSPKGVTSIKQYTGSLTKVPQLQKRYPSASVLTDIAGIRLKDPVCLAVEEAYMIEPETYLDWLMRESEEKLAVEKINDFITSLEFMANDKVRMLGAEGSFFEADKVVFAAGSSSRLWKSLSPDSKLATSTPVQGAYLEFKDINLNMSSFSFTLDDKNLVYRNESRKLLMGSTTQNYGHELPPLSELHGIHKFWKKNIYLDLPEYSEAQTMVGIREKAQRRMPYVTSGRNIFFIGGLYKNGYTLSLKMTKDLCSELLASF